MMTKSRSAVLTIMLAVLPLAVAAAPNYYTPFPYYTPTPQSGKYDAAIALNSTGIVAVNNRDTNVPERIGYIATFPMLTSVGSLGGSDSAISAINDNNQAIGYSTTSDGGTHPFLFTGGRIHDLSADYGISAANALNNRVEVAGSSGSRAMVLRNGTVNTFGPANSAATSINNGGEVAGDFYVNGLPNQASLYSQGQFTKLGTLGGGFSVATALNDDGAVIGTSATADGRNHAYLYENGRMTDLTPAAENSSAVDINNFGQVVGIADNQPFLYADGKLVNPNTLLDPNAYWRMTTPIAINDAGQILSNGCDDQNFCYVTSRFDPIPSIPEAPGAAMLLVGMTTLGAWFASRRKLSGTPLSDARRAPPA